jgi:hypothetical protein
MEWTEPRQVMQLTTHPHLVFGLRMSGAIPLQPHAPLWRTQTQLYSYSGLRF